MGAAAFASTALPLVPALADESEQNRIYLVDACEAYQYDFNYKPYTSGAFSMGGVDYRHGFTCMGYGDVGQGNLTYFNLEGKYVALSFVAGLVGGSAFADPRPADVVISLDGKEALSFTISPDLLPEKHEIDVTGVSQLKFSNSVSTDMLTLGE